MLPLFCFLVSSRHSVWWSCLADVLSGSHAVTGLVASMALEFLVGASVVYGDVSSPVMSVVLLCQQS